MSQLPNAANATVDDQKITHYLLDLTHPRGAGKAKFFLTRGFTQADWPRLRDALLDHPVLNQVSDQMSNSHGEMYEVACSVATPDDTNPCIITVWIIQPSDSFPGFVTAYPNPPTNL